MSSWYSGRRTTQSIPISINNLIVCCGKKTEVNYFSAISGYIKNEYPKITGVNFDCVADAVDPLQMATKVEDRYLLSKNDVKPYNHIWIVFDKDDFGKDNFDNAINKIRKLNNKYDRKNESVQFHSLWSNECIELWFLLHFCYLNTAIGREAYFEKLGTFIGKYKKNDEGIAGKLLLHNGQLSKAISNAEKLLVNNKNNTPANSNPATNVVEFFNFYKNYLGLLIN